MPIARAVRWKTGLGMPLNAPACSARPSASAIFAVGHAALNCDRLGSQGLRLSSAEQRLGQPQSNQGDVFLAPADIEPDVERLLQELLKLCDVEHHRQIGRHGR